MSKSNYAENAVLDWLLGGSTPTRPANRYVALHTADPTEVGNVGELSGNGYARQAATFGAASGGSASNTSTHTFTATGAWGNVTHFSIWDSLTAGNCLFKGSLATARNIAAAGESITVASGALVISED